MAELKTKIKLYLEDNSKTWDEEKVIIQDNMIKGVSSPYIKTWTYDIAKPDDSKIAEYETAGNTQETLNAVLSKRASEYKELKEQFDLLYHDMTAGKGDSTGEWYKHIKAVKDANPKG